MTLDFYRLREQPFGVTPDPRFLYFGVTHREALASMLYGVSAGRGFTALIAKPGMGKTTLLFDFLQKVRNHVRTVFLFQSQCSPQDLLRSVLSDLGIDDEGGDFVRMHRKLHECLSQSSNGKRLLVVLDEAQNFNDSVLELVRMLSNFETSREKLLHLVLAGQPQLAEKLASPHLIQLRQRISIISRLKPFNAEETQFYIDHRLRVAGYDFAVPMFTKRAYGMIAERAEGIPRNINNICFNAMSLGFVGNQKTIDANVIQEVIGDLDLRPMFAPQPSVSQIDEPKAVLTILSSPISSGHFLGTWSLRLGFALGLALLAVMGWPLVRANRGIASVFASLTSRSTKHSPAVPATSSTQRGQEYTTAPATVGPTQPGEEYVPAAAPAGSYSQSDDSQVIFVRPGDNLYRISVNNFGKYDERTLSKVREMNPWLSDPNHIETGHPVRVPTASGARHANISEIERASSALGKGAVKP
jgi:type II secretory pathway predicted ATPase ExeA